MNTRYRIAVSILTCIFFSHVAHSQKKISFGQVSMDELKMSVYDADSAAGAVILYDAGKLDGFTLRFTRHVRIKILNKSGLEWGNWIFNTPSKGEFDVLVFNLDGGRVVKEKAASSSIFNEEVVKGFEVYKVFAPNVKVGSVIDIKYSFYGIPFEWRFQERIPVVYSELVLEQSTFVKFTKAFFGFEPIQTISPYEYKAYDMPAFYFEPFLNNYSNYVTKFQFQVETFNVFGNYKIEYSTTWKRVIENLMDFSGFGGVLEGSVFLNAFAKETKSTPITIEQKIAAAFDYVQGNLKWDGTKSLFATPDLRKKFLEDHSGNSAEINLALITLLNKMDITCYPVALSTRENGMLLPHFPSLDKLNYVVAYVQHEGVEMLLDATSTNISPGILPVYCLNGQGLLIKRDNEQWLTLNRSNRKDIKKQFVTISIGTNGSAKAKIIQDFKDYAFINWAEVFKSHNDDSEHMKNKLQSENPDIEILSYGMLKKDVKLATAKESIEVDVSSQLVDAGDVLIFNPFVIFDYSKNIFESDERKYPVDLACPKELNTTVLIQIPKGFSVKQLPASVRFSNPDGSASFIFLANADASGVQFKATVKLEKPIFTESEYRDLRQFFTEVAKKVNSPLELIKG